MYGGPCIRCSQNIIDKLYDRLKVVFQDNTPRQQVEQALKVLRFLALWKGPKNAAAEYIKGDVTVSLCTSILNSPLEDNLKWDAARLVIQIGFRDRESGVFFERESATVCVTFLEHHLAHEPHNHDPIADAFHALTFSYPMPVYDMGKGDFARGICSALEDRSSIRLRRVALRFVHRIRYRLADPSNVAVQKVFIDHGFSTALKAAWKSVVLAKDCDYGDVDTNDYLKILQRLSNSRIWHPYLLHDHWDTFEYATIDDLIDWLGPLLEGTFAENTFGSKAFMECVRIAWKNVIRPAEDFELVLNLVSLLIMTGIADAHDFAILVGDALRAAEAQQKDTVTGARRIGIEQELSVLKNLVNFFEDVETHSPNGWKDIVASKAKARRRKVAVRMHWRWKKLHSSNADNLT
jgi:hypothetical protein